MCYKEKMCVLLCVCVGHGGGGEGGLNGKGNGRTNDDTPLGAAHFGVGAHEPATTTTPAGRGAASKEQLEKAQTKQNR